MKNPPGISLTHPQHTKNTRETGRTKDNPIKKKPKQSHIPFTFTSNCRACRVSSDSREIGLDYPISFVNGLSTDRPIQPEQNDKRIVFLCTVFFSHLHQIAFI